MKTQAELLKALKKNEDALIALYKQMKKEGFTGNLGSHKEHRTLKNRQARLRSQLNKLD